MKVAAIHDERGYRRVRRALSRHYDIGCSDPDIQVVDVDLAGDRRLIAAPHRARWRAAGGDDAERVLQHLADLWGYDVC